MKPIRKGEYEAFISENSKNTVKIVIIHWRQLRTVKTEIVDTRVKNPIDRAYELLDETIAKNH